jgi:hypothetical protein
MKRESDPDSVVLTQTWDNDTTYVVSFWKYYLLKHTKSVKYFQILLYGIL